MPLTGHCLCGAVRFELTAEPLSAGYCHCTRCQRRTGAAASAQARIPAGALQITAGEEHVRTWQPEQGFAKLFCGICGGALFSHDPTKQHWAVRLGALDPGHGIRPTFRQRVESACEWEPLPDDGLERFEAARPRTTSQLAAGNVDGGWVGRWECPSVDRRHRRDRWIDVGAPRHT